MHDIKNSVKSLKKMFKAEGLELGKIKKVKTAKLGKDLYGTTKWTAQGFVITLNTSLTDERNDIHHMEDTLVHEMVHCCRGCFDHGAEFQRVARQLDKYGYNVQTYGNHKLVVELV